MNTIIPSIIIAIIVAIVLIICVRSSRRAESFSAGEAGLTGVVTLPYMPLSRYEYFPGKDTAGSGYITTVGGLPSNLADRHPYIARVCDETPGCIAFTSTGTMYYNVLPSESRQSYAYPSCGGDCGLFVRKNAVPGQLYVELYPDIHFTTNDQIGRVLVPPGRYPDINYIAGSAGVIGLKMPRNKLSSIRIPQGLKVDLFEKVNFGGWVLHLRVGEHPNLKNYKTGNILRPTWNDEVVSLIVSYDSAY